MTCPHHLKLIALLKATGLIEATFGLAHSPQRCTRAALVYILTEERIREVADATGLVPVSTGRYQESSIVPPVLRFLEYADFPVIVTQSHECDIVARLLIDGLIHGASDNVVGGAPEAVIRGLTATGRARLAPQARKPREWRRCQ